MHERIATLVEIETHWSYADLTEAIMALDVRDEHARCARVDAERTAQRDAEGQR